MNGVGLGLIDIKRTTYNHSDPYTIKQEGKHATK